MAMKSKTQTPKTHLPKETPAPSGTIKWPGLWLSILVLLVYAASINFELTELDDIIFIREQAAYNADAGNLLHSFERGVFSEKHDTYYRPLLLNSFVLNAQLSGTNVQGYHVVNVLLHVLAVWLLFRLMLYLQVRQRLAFLLTVLFAVHPVFVQAVSWIPGRNDTLLGIFALAFLLSTLKFLDTGKKPLLAINLIWLLCALFTKESALFLAPAAWLLLIGLRRIQIFSAPAWMLYGVWISAAGIWFVVRSNASLTNEGLVIADMASNFVSRIPVLIQYLGKAFLPVNQSVFPMMGDTSYVPGVIALIGLAALIYFTPPAGRRIWLGGLGWLLVLLLPVVLLPGALNEQDFEHRLYVPFMGFLPALALSGILGSRMEKYTVPVLLTASFVFTILNIRHQQNFSDPITFWESAVETTPNSGYATMMLAARLDDTDKPRADALMRKAYQLDPDEKYINFYMGKYFLDVNKTDSAAICLQRELEISAYYETYFQLSRLAFMQNDHQQSRIWMEKYLEVNPTDAQAANNYLLLLIQLNDKAAAGKFIEQKRKEGMVFPQELVDQVK